jgi:hypothetical protein
LFLPNFDLCLSLALSLSLSTYHSCRHSLILSQNSTRDTIKCRLNSCNSCCRLLQNLLSSSLTSKNNKLRGCAPKQCLVICYSEMGDKPNTCNCLELHYLPLYSLFHYIIAFAVFFLCHYSNSFAKSVAIELYVLTTEPPRNKCMAVILYVIYNRYQSLYRNIARLMKSKAMRLAEHVARTGEKRKNVLDFVG